MDPKTQAMLDALLAPTQAAPAAPEYKPAGVISEEAFAPAAPKPPKAKRAQPVPGVPAVTPEVSKRSPASAEPVTPPAVPATQKPQIDPDFLEDLAPVLEDYYRRARSGTSPVTALDMTAQAKSMNADRLKKLASIQGVDLEDMAKHARTGVPFEDYKRAKSGSVGFTPVADRQAEIDRVMGDYEKAQKGEASTERHELAPATESPAWTPLTEGYIVGHTAPDEVIETAKPGEHQYAIAEELFKTLAKDKEWSHIYDLYGHQTTGGASLQYINDRAQQIMKNRGIDIGSPNADAEADKARRQATNEVLAMKTIGMWTPGIFLHDVQATEGAKAPGIFAAFGPNVELVGFNNRGMAVYRQESPLGVGLRAIDTIGVIPLLRFKGLPIPIPGQAPLVGMLTKRENEDLMDAAARGIQTGANWMEYALEEAKDSSTPVKYAAGALGLVGAIAHPDAIAALGAASKAVRAGMNTYEARKIFKVAEPELKALGEAYKAGDFEKAKQIEQGLREGKLTKDVIKMQQRADAAFIEMMRAFDPNVDSLNPNLMFDLIAVGARENPELAAALYEAAGKGRPYLHFSENARLLSPKVGDVSESKTLETFLAAGNFQQHFKDIENARQIYLKAVPKTTALAKERAFGDAMSHLKELADDARIANPAYIAPGEEFSERVAKILEANKAEIMADPKKAFAKDGVIRTALKADPITGAESMGRARKSFYETTQAALNRRLVGLAARPMEDVIAHDMKVFDRMKQAVQENIRSRMFAAEAVRRELGGAAHIRVKPVDMADEITKGISAGGQPLSPYAEAYFKKIVRDLPEDAALPEGSKRADVYKQLQNLDVALSAAANRARQTLAEQYRHYFKIKIEEAAAKGEEALDLPLPPSPEELNAATPAVTEAVADAERAAANPAEAAKEDATIEKVARKAASGKMHPYAAELVTNLPTDLGVTEAEATRVLSALDRVADGAEFTKKAVVPGVTEKKFTAMLNALVEEGKVVLLEDGKFVKAKAPELRPLPVEAPTPTAAPAKPVLTEEAARVAAEQKRRGDEAMAKLRAEVAAKNAAARAERQAADEAARVEAARAKAEFEAGIAAQAKPKPAAVAPVAPAAEAATEAAPAEQAVEAATEAAPAAPTPEELERALSDLGVPAAGRAERDVTHVELPTRAPSEERLAQARAPGVRLLRGEAALAEVTPEGITDVTKPAPAAEKVAEETRAAELKFSEDQTKLAVERAAQAEAYAKAAQEKATANLARLEEERKVRAAAQQSRLEAYQAEQVRRMEERAKAAAEHAARVKAETEARQAARAAEAEARRVARAEEEAQYRAMREKADAEYAARKAVSDKARADAEAARVAREAEYEARQAAAKAEQAERARQLEQRAAELEARRLAAQEAAAEAEARRIAEAAQREEEAAKRVVEQQKAAAAERDAVREAAPRLADLEDRFPLARPGNLKDVLREVRGWTTNESYKRIIDRLVEQGGRMDSAELSVAQVGDKGFGFGSFSRGAGAITNTDPRNTSRMIQVYLRGTSVGESGLSLDEIIVHEALHAATTDLLEVGLRHSAKGTKTAEAANAILDLRNTVVRELTERLGDADELAGISRSKIATMANDPHELIAYGMTNPEFQALLKTIKVERNKTLWTKFVSAVANLLGLAPSDESALAALIERTEKLMDVTPEEVEATRLLVFPGSAPAKAAEEAAPIAKVAEEAPLPVARKAKGFSDKNSLDAGVYEVEIGGKTRRFFKDGKEGFYPRSFVEDVPTSVNVPVMPFLGNTKDEAVKALQRMYGAEAVAEEAAPAVKVAEEATAAAPATPSGITPPVSAPAAAEKIVETAPVAKTPEALLADVKSLTHSVVRRDGSFVLGTVVGDTFTPKFVLDAGNAGNPTRIAEAIAAQATEALTEAPAPMKVGEAAGLTPFSPGMVSKKLDKMYAEGDLYASISVATEARRAKLDRARQARNAELIIARTLGEDVAAEWETVPERFRVAAESRLRRAAEGLEAHLKDPKTGITREQYEELVANVTADLAEQKAIRAAQRGALRQRGAAWVRSRLLAAQNAGVLDEAGVDLADWFIQQNPRIADDLGVSVKKAVEGSLIEGEYEPVSRIVVLFKEKGSELTAAHEILHHTERMLPAEVQAAVRKEWTKQLTKALSDAAPEQRPFLEKMLAGTDRKAVMDAFANGTLPRSFYQYVNPSEFWAENASRIVSGRYGAFKAGIVAKAKQWLTEFVAKAKSVFGLSSDAAVIRGLDDVLKGDGTVVSKMLKEGTDYRSIEEGAAEVAEAERPLNQMGYTGMGTEQVAKGSFRFNPATGEGTAVLFSGKFDPSTITHELGHYIRRTVLNASEMEDITKFVQSKGIDVTHKFGDFVGDAAEIEKAEEAFAEAYEVYLATGRAPTTPLQGLFAKIKEVFAALYRSARNGAHGQDIPEEVRRVFDQIYSDAPATAIESTFDVVYRTGMGRSDVSNTDALDALAIEAKRRGIADASVEALNKRVVEFLKTNRGADSNTKVALTFPAPVLGKTEWTGADLRGLQNVIDLRRSERSLAPLKQALLGDVEENKFTEQIYRFVEGIDAEHNSLKQVGKSMLNAFVKSQIGGDIVKEKGLRMLPPAMRQNILTGARLVQQGLGDSITVANETILTGERALLDDFLAGKQGLRLRNGRRIASSGQELTRGFLRLFTNAFEALGEDDKAILEEFAAAMSTPGTLPSTNLRNLAYPSLEAVLKKAAREAENEVNLEKRASIMEIARRDIDKARDAYVDKLIGKNGALPKFLNLVGSGEGQVGPQLAKALQAMYSTPTALSFNEYRFAELLLHLSGSTPRSGVKVTLETMDEMLDATRMLLDESQEIYGIAGTAKGEEFARRLAVLVGTYGTVSTAKAEYQALGVTLSAMEVTALKEWLSSYSISPESRAALESITKKFGLNTKFTYDTILGADVYIPEAARKIIADSLAKAQFSETKLTKAGDVYQAAFSFTKKRMTRGNFVLRQRYYIVNTVDHFHQMALEVGYRRAAASTARLAAQTLLTTPYLGQPLEMFFRGMAKVTGDKTWYASMEKLRDALSSGVLGGDRMAQALGELFGVSKYRLDVTKVLEGSDELIVIGGRATSCADIKRTFIAEGIHSSFDTRQLGSFIRREGTMFVDQAGQLAKSAEASGAVRTAASRAMDAVAEFTTEVVDDMGDAWAERERIGAALTLMESGFDARTASRIVVDGLYDYAQTMTKGDRSALVGLMFPFWTFQKNANQQFINKLFTAEGAYRMMVLKKFRDRATDLVSEIYYNEVGGELGIDVESMPQDMQDYYYSVMEKAHDIYGPSLPADVAVALRMIMTGRTSEVVDGKYVELDADLMRRMQAGAFFPGAAMQAYAMPLKGKNGLPSYIRDRPGVMLVQRRNAVVRHFMALRGQSDDYFYLMLPESSVESAMKHTASSFAALGRMLAGMSRAVPGAQDALGLQEAGIEGTNFLNAIQPIVDLERSPVAGPLINLYVQDRGYPKRLHPLVASFMQRMMDMEIVQVPADMDPFSGETPIQVGEVDEAGKPKDFVSVMGEDYVKRVQDMNKADIDLEDAETVRKRRYYLAPGAYSIAFENTPALGELNQFFLNLEMRPQEQQDGLGAMMYALRAITGFDVAEVSPSKTAAREEPVVYQKTKKPF